MFFSTAELTLRKPLDHDLLDDRVIKALKGQEERKERRAQRKKQVGDMLNWVHIRCPYNNWYFLVLFPCKFIS